MPSCCVFFYSQPVETTVRRKHGGRIRKLKFLKITESIYLSVYKVLLSQDERPQK